VAVAFDGPQGILQAHQFRPEVIILDFHMPGGGGWTVYERLRQTPDTAKTPIVFSTVVALDEVKAKIKPSQNTFFLRTPVGLNQFVSVLGQILGETVVPPPASGAGFSPVPHPAPAAAPPPAAARAPRFHEFKVRVTYADTDKMGIVYYANYLVYAEVGRFQYLRDLGLTYEALLARGLDFTVGEARVKYHAPLRFADEFDVLVWVSEVRRVSWELGYAVDRADGVRCAEASTIQVLLDRETKKPARLPEDLRERLLEALGDGTGRTGAAPVGSTTATPTTGGR
jgi:acyl-CoA thioester hydrolase